MWAWLLKRVRLRKFSGAISEGNFAFVLGDCDKIFVKSIFVLSILQLMNASLRPAVTAVRKLASHAAFGQEELTFRMLDPVKDKETFQRELDLCSKLGTIDLPAATVKDLTETRYSKRLLCEGFLLTNRFVYMFIIALMFINT